MATRARTQQLRILNLTLNLLNTELGLTRTQLQERIGEYSTQNESSSRRAFERDLSALRAAGLVVDVLASDPPRYRIDRASFPAPEVSFSGSDVKLLSRAATSWKGQRPTELALLAAKLSSYAEEALDLRKSAAMITPNLEGLNHLPPILTAIERRQPISFLYASRRGVEHRDVAPWSLILRGRALYLSGFDLNRWAHRRFRLSRISGPLQFVGEPNDYEIPTEPSSEGDSSSFLIGPLLWVRQGRGARIRLRCGLPFPQEAYPNGLSVQEGWDLLLGDLDDHAVWERLLLDDCLHAVPAEQSLLRENLEKMFAAAARWGENTDGE